MCHIRPLRVLGFSSKIRYPPSPNGAPPSKGRGAVNCGEAATTTLSGNAAVKPKNPPRPKGAVPYHSDAWSRSQPPAVQAGQMQYFTPLSFASWAALERFLAVSAPRTLAPSSDSKKGITWSMEHTSSFSSFLRARAASFSPSVPAAFR